MSNVFLVQFINVALVPQPPTITGPANINLPFLDKISLLVNITDPDPDTTKFNIKMRCLNQVCTMSLNPVALSKIANTDFNAGSDGVSDVYIDFNVSPIHL